MTFDQGAVSAADAGWFAGAINIRNARGLIGIDPDEAVLKFATESEREFDIWNEAKAAGEKVAGLGPGVLAIGESDAIDLFISLGADGPDAVAIRDADKPELQLDSLPNLCRVAREEKREFHDVCLRSLLGDGDYGCPQSF